MDKLMSHDSHILETVLTTDVREHLPRLVCLNQLIFDLQRAVRDQLYALKHIDALLLLRARMLDDDQIATCHVAPRFRTTWYDAKVRPYV